MTTRRDVLIGALAATAPIVMDHFGGTVPEKGVQQPGFDALVDLVRLGVAYVKISVNGGQRTDDSPFEPPAKALIAANL